jgi:hypothetical protein
MDLRPDIRVRHPGMIVAEIADLVEVLAVFVTAAEPCASLLSKTKKTFSVS